MLAELTALRDMVRALGKDLERLASTADAEPRGRILSAADTVGFLHRRLSFAIASGSPDDWRTAACQTSGLRKGMADLVSFDPVRDRATVDRVDRAANLALRLCLS